ncbi:MAG TPA: hypothetical protein VMB50_21450 [Myxococcales bacterium]|nr:hypothetical protein [Myxococcales bacterium]
MNHKLALAALAACTLGSSVAARAGYERTLWGMSLNDVQKEYGSDGFERDSQAGHSYLVVRTVAHRTAVIAFFFKNGTFSPRAPYGGLAEVAVTFPREGEAIPRTIGELPRESPGKLAQTQRRIGKLLEAKYGPATQVGADQVWQATDGTVVAFKVRDDLATIVYEPKDDNFDLYLGL